ncbi:TPA: 50S ribosomal protein L14e [Candidatus Bathyarchaeota archaeon]|nr:50S ribosomal protein L14e [Candidatus Bathyarchaeota archaeon]
MVIPEIGRVCVKKTGREAGRQCVVIDTIDKNFVLVTGPKNVTGVRRRRCNVDHLEPTELKLPVRRGADDKSVAEALMKALGKEFPTEEAEKPPAKPARRWKREAKEGGKV